MQLKEYIQAEKGRATVLAKGLEVPLSYLSQMASGNRGITAERASDIERLTGGAVTRKDIFPEKWQRIWPELVLIKRNKASEPWYGVERRSVVRRKADRDLLAAQAQPGTA